MPTLLGNRIFLEMPKEEESKLIVDENTKEALQKEMLIKMSKLTVHTVGNLVEHIKVGDVVLVDPAALQKSSIIPLSDTEFVIMTSVFDVIQIW
jgi:hypothetical protein